jgi:transcriptional regulator with XRE-family HTH domain
MITAEQIRAARGALRMDQAVLAKQARVSVETIKRLERGTGPLRAQAETLHAIMTALERAGIEFMDEDRKERRGAGVRIVEDWSRVFRQQIRKAVRDFASPCAYLHEDQDPEFLRRGLQHVFDAMMKDFGDGLRQELRKWAEAGDIKEPKRQRRTGRTPVS